MEKAETQLKQMRRGVILMSAGFAVACGAAILVIVFVLGVLSWNKELLDRTALYVTVLAVVSCTAWFTGLVMAFIAWVKGLAMLNRGGLKKPMLIDIGLSALCAVVPFVTVGSGMFIMPVAWYLIHAWTMKKLGDGKQDKNDLYSLGEVK